MQLAVVVLFFVALEVGLRLAGLAPHAPDDDPYVGFSGALPLFVEEADGRMVTAPYKRNHFNVQSFPAEKPPGTTRIVCLGGSTTYGRPYADATSFAGWLRAWLPAAAPDRGWEVINAGGISYASYRVRVVLDELLQYDPDVVVLYTGHNEFLEERTYPGLADTPGWVLRLGALARRSALFGLLRELVADGSPPDGEAADAASGGLRDADGREVLSGEVSTLLDRSVGPAAYARDDALRDRVLEHYRLNLASMTAAARAAGAVVVLVAPASELVGCRPFKSEHSPGVDDGTAARIDALTSRPGDADRVQLLVAAAEEDPRNALAWYRAGEALLDAGRIPRARAALERARDEDIVPLRAPSPIRAVVEETAADHGARFVDAVALAERAAQELAGRAIPGPELFLDHVHMTPDGYRRVALAIWDELVAAGVVVPAPDWDEASRAAVDVRVLATLTTEDHVRALNRLASVLDWAGKSEEAETLTDRALAMGGGADAMSRWLKGNFHLERGELAEAVASYDRALAVDPGYGEAHANRAAALRELGRLDEALASAREAARLSPGEPGALFALAALLDESGRTDDARDAFHAVLRVDGDHADALNALGLLALREQDAEAAEGWFRRATEAAPDASRGHYNLGLLLARTRRGDEAEGSFRRALEAEPGHVAARLELAVLLLRSDRGPEAMAILDGLPDMVPEGPAGDAARARAAALLEEARSPR